MRLGLGLTVRYSAVGVGVNSALQCDGVGGEEDPLSGTTDLPAHRSGRDRVEWVSGCTERARLGDVSFKPEAGVSEGPSFWVLFLCLDRRVRVLLIGGFLVFPRQRPI